MYQGTASAVPNIPSIIVIPRRLQSPRDLLFVRSTTLRAGLRQRRRGGPHFPSVGKCGSYDASCSKDRRVPHPSRLLAWVGSSASPSHNCQPKAIVGHPSGRVWQKRFCDFNVCTDQKGVEKLRYMHRNPVKRGLVQSPEQWELEQFPSLLQWRKGSGQGRSCPWKFTLRGSHCRENKG